MSYRLSGLLSFVVMALGVVFAAAAIADEPPFTVNTYDQEFINWATAHQDTFTFPPRQLYTQVLCHMTIGCPAAPADCDPWDRFANLKIRRWLEGDTYEDYEIARFITPYDITYSGAPGTCSWTLDVTSYQFLLHDDVTLRLYIESWMGNQNGWLMTVDFEMFPGVPEREPYAIERLWSTGNLRYGDPDMPPADFLQPISVNVPEETTWAEVRTFSTGHGFWNTDNAAEFSYKWQRVGIDGSLIQHYLWRDDCAANRCSPQGGTWHYNRAGWCPGDGAAAWVVDATNYVTPGQDNVFGFYLHPYTNQCRPNNPDCVEATGCDCSGHAYYKLESQVVFYRIPSISAVDGAPTAPGQLHLVGNHPNPFNPSTTIQYHLAVPGAVTVKVYDADGATVKTVDFEHAVPGLYSWTWNGRDGQGQQVPSGVYVYEVRYGTEHVSAKMLLLK